MTDCSKCERNERQARKITALNLKVSRLKKRVDVQQWIIDKQRESERTPTAQEIAEQFFKEVTGGEG